MRSLSGPCRKAAGASGSQPRSRCLAHPGAPSRPQPCAGQQRPAPRAGWATRRGARSDDEEPDWDREMSIFKQRTMRPNQLATLRELESKVSVGKVLWHRDGLAIISGLNDDAPLGTKLAFVSGASGVLLWHRSDNLAFALVTGGAHLVQTGEGVECKIKGVLQVVDEAKGPITKKDYDLAQAPAGDALYGSVVDFMGRPLEGFPLSSLAAAEISSTPTLTTAGSATDAKASPAGVTGGVTGAETAAAPKQQQSIEDEDMALPVGTAGPFIGFDRTRPLVNQQVAMKNREQITESLTTGVKALDILTPLGRGASLLVIGPSSAGKSSVALDAAIGQAGQSGSGPGAVRVVMGITSQTRDELQATVAKLQAGNALANTAVFAAPSDADWGAKLATLYAAASAGERSRDDGGHSLVILDDIAPLLRAWEELVLALAELGREMVREGLIKDEEGRDVSLVPRTEQELVDYEGMLVSGAAAQRRGFFSTLFMRSAKMHRAWGGGSMSLLPLVPGRPATGSKKGVDMSKYQTLSEEQKRRIAAVLAQREKLEAVVAGAGELGTEAVEEFMSISDGQLVLEAQASSDAPGPYRANPRLSITRIGTRAYPRVLEDLAPQIRLQLAQADDARRFALEAANDPLLQRHDAYCKRIAEALLQPAGAPVPLEDQAVILFAIKQGYADAVPPAETAAWVARTVAWVRQVAPRALREVAESRVMTAAAEKDIANALAALGGGGASR